MEEDGRAQGQVYEMQCKKILGELRKQENIQTFLEFEEVKYNFRSLEYYTKESKFILY